MFCKKGVLKNFAKFTGKHLCQRLWRRCFPVTLAQVFSCDFCKIFKNNIFFIEHLRWLLLLIAFTYLMCPRRFAFMLANYLWSIFSFSEHINPSSRYVRLIITTSFQIFFLVHVFIPFLYLLLTFQFFNFRKIEESAKIEFFISTFQYFF